MIGCARTAAALAVVVALGAPSAGCAFAVEHPAVAAGIVGGTLALGTCKLASDNLGACLAVGGGAGAFLALVATAAIWLGGDGHSVAIEEQARPLPAEDRPLRRRPPPPDASDPADPTVRAPRPSSTPPTPPPPPAPPPPPP